LTIGIRILSNQETIRYTNLNRFTSDDYTAHLCVRTPIHPISSIVR